MNHQLKFKNMRTGDKVFDIVNYTLLTLIMLIVLYPVLYIVAASFSDPQAVVSGEVFILPVRPTLRGTEPGAGRMEAPGARRRLLRQRTKAALP